MDFSLFSPFYHNDFVKVIPQNIRGGGADLCAKISTDDCRLGFLNVFNARYDTSLSLHMNNRTRFQAKGLPK